MISYIVGCRQAQKAATEERVIAVSKANPKATQQQKAEIVGVTQGRVSQVISEVLAKSEPKLLKHGGNMAEQGAYRQLENKGSNKADYILARLQRDGHTDLADQVKAGKLSARKAAMEAGFKAPESQLTALKRAWKKANEDERSTFIDWANLSAAHQ